MQSNTTFDQSRLRASRRSVAGFTLLEIMVVIAIVGVLASLALPAYSRYVQRAKMVEVTALVAEVKTSLAAEYASGDGFPDQLLGSASRIAARQSGKPRVRARDRFVRLDSELVRDLYYEYNPRNQFAYVGIRLNRDAVPDCAGRCELHIAATDVGGQLQFLCGRWTAAYWRNPWPPASVTRECHTDNVNRSLRRMRRGI